MTLIICVLASVAHADSGCSLSNVSDIVFTPYNVFQSTANDFGIGTITVSCEGKKNKSFNVSLSTGQSNTFSKRQMKSGQNILTYNLFTSSARDVVWGDGSGGSRSISENTNNSQLNIFGSIYPLQNVNIGYYSDFITVCIDF